MDRCLICSRIEAIRHGTNPYVVAELASGYVVLGDHQYFRGYTLLLSKRHASELHELGWDARTQLLQDMALTAEAVFQAFRPAKLNYELLGNGHRHLHWHIFPRHSDDPNPRGPVWEIDALQTTSDAVRPAPNELIVLKSQLANEIVILAEKYQARAELVGHTSIG